MTLLEAQKDFDREFRGDGLHSSVLELLDEIGLLDGLLELPHSKVTTMTAHTESGRFTITDYREINSRFPYVTILPQVHLLEHLAEKARRFPHFRLVMGARVRELVEEDGTVRGARYQTAAGCTKSARSSPSERTAASHGCGGWRASSRSPRRRRWTSSVFRQPAPNVPAQPAPWAPKTQAKSVMSAPKSGL